LPTWPLPLTGAHVPNELSFAGPEHLDPDVVAAYDTKQVYDPAPDVAALRGRGLGPSSVVLDMGAGTGTFAFAMAPHCARVIAVDVSAPMLTRLLARADERGVDNITVERAGFLTYEHRGDPVDSVFSRNALHQLPDAWKAVALGRLAAILRPGGLLWLRDLVYACEPAEFGDVVTGWFKAAVVDPAAGYTAQDLATHVGTEFSTFTWLLEPMLQRAGLSIVDVEIDPRRTFARYACVKR
jgi:ubiquinone/menaquinone biosynthesis C-methylase UbiE